MRKIRYLSVLLLLLHYCGTVLAQDDFNPESPSEPGAPPTRLVLLAEPLAGGTLSGGGKYVPEAIVSIRAYNNAGFVFEKWTDKKGNVIATTAQANFMKSATNDTLIAHFAYSPDSPAEPIPGTQLVYYKLALQSSGGGSVSGGGKYRSGTSVSIRAYAETNFEFVNWTNDDGDIVSTTSNFNYITNGYAEVLTANFMYNPSNPTEPSDPVLSHDINVTCTEGGSTNFSSVTKLSGSTHTLHAYPNEGYVFIGWYINGELYTALKSFSYTVGDSDVDIEARFEFNPDSPSEPQMPEDKKYSMYLMSEITFPGNDIECPMYLTSLDTLCDITFQINFPSTVVPDWKTLELGFESDDYTISVSETSEDTVFLVSIVGDSIMPGNTKLFNLKVQVPEEIAANSMHQIKINQVVVSEPDGKTTTCSTRNGKIYIYQLGDTNGDGEVNITDRVNMINYIMVGEADNDTFIKEVSDINGDGEFNITDGVGIVEILLNE